MKANRDFDSKKEIEVSYDDLLIESTILPQSEGESHRQITLSISQDASSMDNAPYSFSIEMVGLFEAVGVKESEQERFIYIQGSSILYGMARDALIDAMTKGPFVTVSLPLVSFYKSRKQLESADSEELQLKKKTAKKAAKRSPRKTAKKTKSLK